MATVTIGVRAITRPKNSTEAFMEGRFLVDIPAGTDVFVYKDGVQHQSDAVKEAWQEQHGYRQELKEFILQ